MRYEISMDFYHDWAQILKKQLQTMNYNVESNLSPDEICKTYYGLLQRLIPQRPRKVEMSKEFSCPPEHKAGLDLLVEKIKKGDDLTPHLSSLQRDLNYTDPLLSDWGIYHLHLGTRLDSRGLVNRTGPILFALFTNDTAYFINVYQHGRDANHQPWTMQDLIRIVDTNWPHITEPFKLKGAMPERILTDEEYAMLRNSGVYIVSIAGMFMAPMGGGITTARTSVFVRKMCDDIANQMRGYEKWIRDHIDEIVNKVREKSDYKGDKFNFSLSRTDTGKIEITETNSVVLVAHAL